jgi:hypothetical protein
MTPPTGKAIVRIDDASIKARMREYLADAWDEGRDAVLKALFVERAAEAAVIDIMPRNPYRDEAQA